MDAVQELGLPVTVHTSADGSQLLDALYQAGADLPDIIILDINMPFKNGFECLAEIRSGDGPFNDIKVIMFSTSRSPENISRSYELGADFYAIKPATYGEYKKLIQSVTQIDWSTAGRNKTQFLLF